MDKIRINNPDSRLGDGDIVRIIWGFIMMWPNPSYFGLVIKRTINIPDKDHAERFVLQQAKPTFCEAHRMRSIMLLKNFLPNLTLDMQLCFRCI